MLPIVPPIARSTSSMRSITVPDETLCMQAWPWLQRLSWRR
jgi:hypothetical protein